MNTIKLIKNHTSKLIPLGLSLLNPGNTVVVLKNMYNKFFWGYQWEEFISSGKHDYDSLINSSLDWIKYSQDKVGSGGVGCYEFYRWTTGYPEVTGYIIPTMWQLYNITKDEDLKKRAIAMADWELKIQNKNGGWEGFYEGDNQPVVVFNTGQVIRGLIETYTNTNEKKYLDSAIRAADWIVANQDEDGSWTKTNFKQMKRVYDTYVSAPLAHLYIMTGDEKYKNSAIKNCEFTLRNQHPNGWFELCDNTLLNNEAPVTHTICYTIDGLIDVGVLLKEEKYILAGKKAADALMHRLETSPFLSARYDKDWKRRANYVCNTGNAQLGIILLKLYEIYDDPRYLNASLKIADYLAFVQKLNAIGKARSGGISGSYPIWGMYCPFKYPSWATKYFIDFFIMLKKNVQKLNG